MSTLKPIPLWLLLLAACQSDLDVDGDGLTLRDETALGTNPDSPDTDNDGLSDLLEVREFGTSPIIADTDDDGAEDGFEFDLCLDPLDAASHPYTLGWPMAGCLMKDELTTGISPPIAELGSRVRRAFLYDRLGEVFDLYDLAGRPSLIGLFYSDNLGRGQSYVDGWAKGIEPLHPEFPSSWIRDLGVSGDIFVTLIVKSVDDEFDMEHPPTLADVSEFCTFDNFGCFGDISQELRQHAGIPPENLPDYAASWFLLDERMIVRNFIDEVGEAGSAAFHDMEQNLSIMLDITPP